MNTKRRKASFRKWMLLPIFSVVTVSACVAVGCGDEGHKHEWQEHAATDSTCMVAGHELYYTCRGCELIFDAQKNEISAIPEKPLLEHVWGEGVKTADATCTHGEEFTYTCSVGGETKKEYVGEALGHTFGEYTYNDDATCVDEGTQSAVCSRCGETDYKSYPALGHELGEIIPETNVKCQENLAAHYRCSRCEGYFNANQEETTLEELTIPAVHNWQKTTTVLRHSLECLDCGKSYEGLHEFDSLSDFVCNDPDCAYERDHDRQIVNWFENENGVARLNWDDGSQYTRSFVTLPREIGKPAGALDVGDKAFKMTTKAGCGDAYPVIRLSGVTDCLKDYNDADYLLIWTYLTGTQGVDGLFLLGNTREDGIFYDGDPGQSYVNNTHLPKLGASGEWRAIKLTVAELKSALQKQGSISAEWAFIYFNVSSETDIYLYSVELHRESAQAITVKGDAANYVTVADCAVPMSKVAFTVQDLPYGSFVRIIDDATGLEIHSAVGSGTFVMPYAGVTVEVVDLFAEDALQSITTNVRRSNRIALPAIYDDWQDSCILTVLKNGSTVSEESYRYNAASGEIVFYGGGTYTLTYTLKKEGAADKTLTRSMTVHGALMSYLTEAERTAYYEWAPNVTSEYVALPSSVGKPAGAEDIGDYARKYEMNGDWEFAPVLYLGDLLTRTDLRDSDYIRIWIYSTSVHYNNECNAYWFGNVNENGKFSEATDNKTTYSVADEYANINKWHAYQITLGDLRAQLAKQNLQSAEWLRFGMGPHNDATLYIYSVELYRETAREITVDDSAKDYVMVAQSAYPLDAVTVTVSGLEYGQSLIVMQGEEIIKTISVNGQTSFVMPSGAVTITFVNVFENTELEDITTNIYRTDNIAIPSLFDGWYDSFTLTVKKGDTVVAASEYKYDEENYTILFVEGGTYTLTYTLKKEGAADKTLTRSMTVHGALMSYLTEAERTAYYEWAPNVTSEYVALPSSVGKPAGAEDIGDYARKYEMNGDWEFAPVLYLGDLLTRTDLRDSDYIRIWIYSTSVHYNNECNAYWFGNVNENGKFSEATDNKTTYSVADEYANINKWHAYQITLGDLRAQLAKQNLQSAEWLRFGMGPHNDATLYIYSVELYRETAREITVDDSAKDYVMVAQSAYPLDAVTVTVSGLEYGQSLIVMQGEEIIKTISVNGQTSFVMPSGAVTITFVNVFENTELEDITTNIYRTDNIAIPSLFDGWYDSFTLTVKKGDTVVAASEYKYDEENYTILFVEGGTYTLTYTLKKDGAADVELTRTVTVSGALMSFATEAEQKAYYQWANTRNEYVELPQEIGKPAGATDIGNYARKYSMVENEWQFAPVLYLGDLLSNLDQLHNGDILRIWLYKTGAHYNNDNNFYWFANVDGENKVPSDIASDKKTTYRVADESGNQNVWYAFDITVADMKAQFTKQGALGQYLLLGMGLHESSTIYIYSLEIVKARAQTISIDSTAQEHVSGLSETQLPLETVTFTVSGLGDGEAICVVNNSTNEKVLTVTQNGEASFVMPYAGVTLKLVIPTSPTVVESFDTMDSVKTITWSQESGTTRELVSAATEGIGTPDEAVKKGGNILKCTISGDDNWAAITVIKIGDLLQEPETLKDNDTVKIWVYFTDEHWDGTDVTNYYVGGLNADEKFDPIWDNRTGMTTATCTKGTWGAITLTGADLKAAAEKKSGDGTGWMCLQFNMNVNSVVYIYSVELYPA